MYDRKSLVCILYYPILELEPLAVNPQHLRTVNPLGHPVGTLRQNNVVCRLGRHSSVIIFSCLRKYSTPTVSKTNWKGLCQSNYQAVRILKSFSIIILRHWNEFPIWSKTSLGKSVRPSGYAKNIIKLFSHPFFKYENTYIENFWVHSTTIL